MSRRCFTVISLAGLAAAWGICRLLLFDLHGMKSWPNLLACFGLAVVAAAVCMGRPWTALSVPFGYLAGFFAGLAFRREGVDMGGGATSNLWVIWTGGYLLVILIVWAAEHLCRRRGRG